MSNLIDKEWSNTVCRLGQGNACCRYLACGKDGLECLKHTPFAPIVDQRAADKTMTAQSDNCEGKR